MSPQHEMEMKMKTSSSKFNVVEGDGGFAIVFGSGATLAKSFDDQVFIAFWNNADEPMAELKARKVCRVLNAALRMAQN